MTSNALATADNHGTGLALDSDQPWWNDRQLAALRQLGVDRASNGDLAVFLHVAQRTGLDPFARQIYLIERAGKQTIQTGIDGFRLVARRAVDRSGETLSIGGSEWCDAEGHWTDVWLPQNPPAAARVIVRRDGQEFPGTALWREYAQTKRDGGLMAQWATRPAGMLAKCAEALALRKAFPQDLAGIYTEDEMASGSGGRRSRTTRSPGLAVALRVEEPADEGPVEGELVDEPGDQSVSESPTLDMRSSLAKKMFAVMGNAGILDELQHEYLSKVLGRTIDSRKDLTEADAKIVIDATEEALAEPFPQDEQ